MRDLKLLRVVLALLTVLFSHPMSLFGDANIIKIDGSSTVYLITEAVAEEYSKIDHDKVTIAVSGTGGGFKRFCRGEIDIADASRVIKPQEISTCQSSKIEYLEIPIAYDGLAVVVNPENTFVDYLTVEELKTIWEPSAQGNILKWSQVRSGWPELDIKLFGPGADSGTFDYFTEAINGKPGASRGDFTASEDDNVLVEGVIGEKGGLGYFGLAYYTQNKDRLKLVPIANGPAKVVPDSKTIKDGSYKPLSRLLYLYVNKQALQNRPSIKRFIDFYMKHVSDLAEEVGYVPLSEKQLEESVLKLQ